MLAGGREPACSEWLINVWDPCPDIQAFAASIAALGMLEQPAAEPQIGPRGKATGNYPVNAGEGRHLAQLLRFKGKEIKADEPIHCILDTEHSATEIGLAGERDPLRHPPTFAKLHSEEGMSAEDITSRFGLRRPWSGNTSNAGRSAPS